MKKYNIGDKIKFKEEKQRYTVRACDDRYLVCTKPFNPRKTFMYTMVDLKEGIRGRDGFILCGGDYTNEEEARDYIKGLRTGEAEISRRHRMPLNIEN